MRVLSYRMTRDYGFAPNPYFRVCTLATCKPRLRASADRGDLVVGCGSAEMDLVGRIIYVMRVHDFCSFEQYWNDQRFLIKRPFFRGNRSRAHGDNIYHRNAQREWVQEKSQHSWPDGTLHIDNLNTDTSTDRVLWGTDFVYFGRSAIAIPDNLRSLDGFDLYASSRDYDCRHSKEFVAGVDAWFQNLPLRGYLDRPGSWD